VLSICSFATYAYDIDGFTLSGDERAGWVSYDYGNPEGNPLINKDHKDSKGFYVMPSSHCKRLDSVISRQRSPLPAPPILALIMKANNPETSFLIR
jgi:hypothetical protein